MISIGYEQIDPVPVLPSNIVVAKLHGLPWGSGKKRVALFKDSLKPLLRAVQKGRCSFCRRLLYDDYAAHLEHFIEHSIHQGYRFEIRNLSLSCGTCNGKKNGYYKSLNGLVNKRAARGGLAPIKRSPVLGVTLAANSALPLLSENYRWVHPYFDRYSENIEIQKGWIFVGRSRKGHRTIRSVRLNDLAQIERRALAEKLALRKGRLSMLVSAAAELSSHRAGHVLELVAKDLRRRREAAGN